MHFTLYHANRNDFNSQNATALRLDLSDDCTKAFLTLSKQDPEKSKNVPKGQQGFPFIWEEDKVCRVRLADCSQDREGYCNENFTNLATFLACLDAKLLKGEVRGQPSRGSGRYNNASFDKCIRFSLIDKDKARIPLKDKDSTTIGNCIDISGSVFKVGEQSDIFNHRIRLNPIEIIGAAEFCRTAFKLMFEAQHRLSQSKRSNVHNRISTVDTTPSHPVEDHSSPLTRHSHASTF